MKVEVLDKKKSFAPKLRFKGFDGKWKSIIIGDHVISSAFGPRFSSDLYSDSGNVLTLRTTDMDNDGNICYDKLPLAKLNLDELKEHILLKGDLVISRSGTIGVTGVFQGYSTPVIPGAFLIRFRFNKDALLPDFVRLYFNCSKGRNEIESLSAGGVQKNLTGTSVLKMSLVAPDFPEQQKIASFLSAVDEKIQQLTHKKELLEQYKKGVMQQIFSGKLRFKDEDGKAFPKWEEKRLGDFGDTFNGLTGKTKENFGEGKPYIQYMQIFSSSKIDVTKCGLVQIGENENQPRVQYGDVFFTTSSETPNEIGTCSVLLEETK
ncbi:MAG: restriction endonuclease subunit S, partial [Sphingobacteriales bacterium]|nr:restriction endonuclease subunit S [Sphingobacteriales bacterium]